MTSHCPQCVICSHLDLQSIDDASIAPMRCRAFPHGIPTEILLNEHDHREAYPGDLNVRFTLDCADEMHPLELVSLG